MKYTHILFGLLLGLVASTVNAQYRTDMLDDNYQQQTFVMPDDYEGKTVCTLVRKAQPQAGRKAILYIHGYNDYFFQAQLGDSVIAHGYNFYALDLRKYGRSLLSNQDAFYCKSLKEYFADIDTAIACIQKEGNREIILMGHSTGGLISSYYLKYHPQAPVCGLVLNSPFLDWNFGWFMESILIPSVSFIGKYFPDWIIQGTSGDASYAKSLLKAFKGEWIFDTSLKMPLGHPKKAGWIRAIHTAQQDIQESCAIQCPILLLSSTRSYPETDEWHDEYMSSDIVLSVDDIQKFGKRLGPNVTARQIEGGIHDLILSPKPARDHTYQILFGWLDSIK